MASIKVRLKKALDGGPLGIAQGGGWFTEGHWAIHRDVLIEQGLALSEPVIDALILKAMGFETEEGPTAKSAARIFKQKGELIPFATTGVLFQSVFTSRLLHCKEHDLNVWVQDYFLYLLCADPLGLTLYAQHPPEGKQVDTALVDSLTAPQFAVMPIRTPIHIDYHGHV